MSLIFDEDFDETVRFKLTGERKLLFDELCLVVPLFGQTGVSPVWWLLYYLNAELIDIQYGQEAIAQSNQLWAWNRLRSKTPEFIPLGMRLLRAWDKENLIPTTTNN